MKTLFAEFPFDIFRPGLHTDPYRTSESETQKRISVLQYIQCHYLRKKIEVTKV